MNNGFETGKVNHNIENTYWTLILINKNEDDNIDCYYEKNLALLNEYICTHKLENQVFAIIPVKVPKHIPVDDYIHDFVEEYVETYDEFLADFADDYEDYDIEI